MKDDGLNHMQDLFIEAYLGQAAGNGTQSAKIAGYRGNDATLAVTANRLLKNSKIQTALAERRGKVAGRWRARHLRDWWRQVIEDDSNKLKDRVKASELLGKSLGAFVERSKVEHKHLHAHVGQLDEATLRRIAATALGDIVDEGGMNSGVGLLRPEPAQPPHALPAHESSPQLVLDSTLEPEKVRPAPKKTKSPYLQAQKPCTIPTDCVRSPHGQDAHNDTEDGKHD
jgi:phage terminase small subunit